MKNFFDCRFSFILSSGRALLFRVRFFFPRSFSISVFLSIELLLFLLCSHFCSPTGETMLYYIISISESIYEEFLFEQNEHDSHSSASTRAQAHTHTLSVRVQINEIRTHQQKMHPRRKQQNITLTMHNAQYNH